MADREVLAWGVRVVVLAEAFSAGNVERSRRRRRGRRREKRGLTLGEVDHHPPLQEGHCHRLQQHRALPAAPLPNVNPPHRARVTRIAHAPDQFPMRDRLRADEHARAAEERPALTRLEGLAGAQLVDHGAGDAYDTTLQADVPHCVCGEVLHARHFQRVGIAEHDAFPQRLPLARRRGPRFRLGVLLFLAGVGRLLAALGRAAGLLGGAGLRSRVGEVRGCGAEEGVLPERDEGVWMAVWREVVKVRRSTRDAASASG